MVFVRNTLEGEQVVFVDEKLKNHLYLYIIVSTEGTSTFAIRSVTAEDCEKYTCLVSSDVSTDRNSAKFRAEGEENFPDINKI